MTEAAVLFKQTGASDEDAAKLAQLANLYMNVADNEMTASDASAYITSQMKAFNISANEAITILDKTNEVSNQFAVSSSDISKALTTSSSSLSVYGNNINEVIGLVTAGTEIMTGKSQQVGRGLRSIGANIASIASSAGELDIQVNGVTKTISLIDEETGDMINTFEALSRVHEYWDEMTNSEQAALSTTLAGKTQMDVFSSVLSNFNTAVEANTTAIQSNGSAWEENNKRADSISAKLNLLQSQLQELVLGDGGLQSLAKTLLDVGTAILKFANSDIGQVIIKFTLLQTTIQTVGTGFTKLTSLMGKMGIAQLVKDVIALKNGFTTVATSQLALDMATKGFTTTLLANAAAWAATPMGMATIAITAIAGIAVAINALNPSLEKLNSNIQEINSNYDETTGNIENLETSLKDIKEQIDKIRSKDKIELTDQTQLEMLQKEEASLENQLLLQQELLKTQQKEATKGAVKVLSKHVSDAGAFGEEGSFGGSTGTGTVSQALTTYTNQIDTLQQKLEPLLEQKQRLEDTGQKESDQYKELSTEIATLTEKQDSARESAADYAQTIEEAIENADETNDKVVEGQEALDGYYDVLKDVYNQTNETSDGVSYLGDSIEDTDEDTEESISTAEALANAWSDWNSAIDDIQSAYSTLSDAVNEYNTQGGYSIDTIQSLLALDPSYLAALQEENGQMKLNTDYIKQKIEAQANEAKQIIYNTAIEKLNALASKSAGEASSSASAQHSSATTGINNETNALLKNTQAQYSNAIAKARAAGGSSARSEINQIIKETQSQLKLVDQAVNSVGTNFNKAMSTATKSTNGATGAVNSQKNAVKSLQSQLESQISSLESKRDSKVNSIEKEIDALKDEKEAAVDAIEDQIDAIDKAKDAEIDAIEAQIDAIEDERDIRKKYWEEQLDNLERQNQAVKDGIELQQKLSDLATAQQTKKMVFKDGRFVYTSDSTAISTAQEALDEFNREKEYEKQKQYLEDLRDMEDEKYEERLDSLNNFKKERQQYYEQLNEQLKEQKEKTQDYYDNQVKALENYRDDVKEQYNKQIDDLKNQKNSLQDTYAEMLNAQNEYQNASLANARSYYNTSLSEAQAYAKALAKAKAGDGYVKVDSSGNYKVVTASDYVIGTTTWGEIKKGTAERRATNTSSSSSSVKLNSSIAGVGSRSTGDNYVSGYASGVNQIDDSTLSVVGENPKYREIVIGSKLNNDQGLLMNLKRGSGVVNAKATNTLASIFNALSGQRSVGQAINTSNSNSTKIEIGSISLPQVTDGQSFVNYLQNFKTDLTQRAFCR